MKFDNLIMLVLFLAVVFAGGILAGVVYFDMELLDNTLRDIDFDLPMAQNSTTGAVNVTTFQDVLELTVYPILGLRDSLRYLTYFMVFSFIIALGITAYITTKNPIFFIVHLLFTFLVTYFCFVLSNSYITMLTDPFINNMMVDFVIYNKLMIYLPQIVFFTSLIFGGISFVNIMKPQTQNVTGGLNYGGDY